MSPNISSFTNADLLTLLCGQAGNALANASLIDLFGLRPAPQPGLCAEEAMHPYVVHPQFGAAKELLSRAMLEVLVRDSFYVDPSAMKDYLRTKIGGLDYESFWVVYLNVQHQVIIAEEAFRGTLTQTSVYPREIVKRALAVNASSVVLSHNHPSGSPNPSTADEHLTNTLKTALALIDVRVIDHIIVGADSAVSMAEKGLV